MISSLSIYIVGIGSAYFALMLSFLNKYKGKLFVVLSVLLLGVIATFRGAVGTDTTSYESIIGRLRTPFGFEGYEPGFSLFIWMLSLFTESNVIVVRLISAFFCFSLLLYIRNSNKDELFFLLAYVLPVLFFQYSMNVLRIGLATCFIMLSIQFFRRDNRAMASCLALVACLFHYSAIISILSLVLMSRSVTFNFKIFCILGSLFFFGMAFFGPQGYFSPVIARIELYESVASPSSFSGLSILLVLSLALIAGGVASFPHRDKFRFIAFSSLLIFFASYLALYSYAGLRVLNLLLFAVPAALLVLHNQAQIRFNYKVRMVMLFAGAVGLLSNFRNFISTAGTGSSPFLPYEWLF